MATIALVGPHAVGKTTAVNRWQARYPKLIARHCDNEPPLVGSKEVVVLEGCSAHANQWLTKVPVDQVIHCFCSPEVMAGYMRQRCEKANKVYRQDYWDYKRLEYESKRRMDNLLGRLGIPTTKFCIDNRSVDWTDVDQYFDSLYRSFHNQIVRSKR